MVILVPKAANALCWESLQQSRFSHPNHLVIIIFCSSSVSLQFDWILLVLAVVGLVLLFLLVLLALVMVIVVPLPGERGLLDELVNVVHTDVCKKKSVQEKL